MFAGAMTAGGNTLTHYVIGGLLALIGLGILINYYRKYDRSYLSKNRELFKNNLSNLITSLQ
jgi:hypothetical protein